jgi:anti-anti-sigma factor
MSPEIFKSRSIDASTLLITLGASLDNNNAHLLMEQIASAIHGGIKYILLDMEKLEFISSAGVGAILGTVESLRNSGGDIVLFSLCDKVRHVLEVLDLTDYLTIRKSLSDSLAMCETTRIL